MKFRVKAIGHLWDYGLMGIYGLNCWNIYGLNEWGIYDLINGWDVNDLMGKAVLA